MPAFRARMRARDTGESHRVSSPLELLFDLTFVVGISQLAGQLAEHAESGQVVVAIVPFASVFFAIWWAWMNFTWFASAYDTDDVPYRIATLVQMAGVLVLAAGVPAAFDGDFLAVTVGYAIMRLALVSQWLRAAVAHPQGRATAVRYALGILIVQALWLGRLALPWANEPWIFAALAVLELLVPPLAERTGGTAWHPHHIAERYGLFTIIVLGESVLAATVAVSTFAERVSLDLVVVAASGLVLVFALWWIYFAEPAGAGLENHRGRSFFWGYGHYLVFASLAAIGAGLEVSVAYLGHHTEADAVVVAYGLAVPVALFLLLVWVLHAPLGRVAVSPVALVAGVVVVLLLPLVADVPLALAGMAAVSVLVVASTYARRRSGVA